MREKVGIEGECGWWRLKVQVEGEGERSTKINSKVMNLGIEL